MQNVCLVAALTLGLTQFLLQLHDFITKFFELRA
jgi:hypothetical protein